MRKLKLEVYNNELVSRQDFQKLLHDIVTPLEGFFVDGDSLLYNNNYSSGIPDKVSSFEGFSRILWGLASSDQFDKDHVLWVKIRNGLTNGTDPDSPFYYGTVWNYDQNIVEMAAIAYAMIYKPECIYNPLSKETKKNLYNWLNQANYREAHHCNWKFFRVLVNVAFRKMKLKFDKTQMDDYLTDLDSFYIGNGWYSDGTIGSTHIDYYVAFAFHFYGLIYADTMKRVDPRRSKRFIDRAIKFSESYMYLFSSNGDAVPYGRSMVYRFAQVSFFSMFAKMGLESSLELSETKGIIFRHLRWWNSQFIYDSNGHLTNGYAYECQTFTEQYNGPTSMYWALKAFAFLMIPEDNDFWSVKEKDYPALESRKVIDDANMLVLKSSDQSHTLLYTPGYAHTTVHTHNESKYEKLVYSNVFGFSVPKSNKNLTHGSFDNTFVISEDGSYFRHKELTSEARVTNEYVMSKWMPFSDVSVTTIVVPVDVHHFRVHIIENERKIEYADAGFAFSNHTPQRELKDEYGIGLLSENGYSYITDLTNTSKCIIVGAYNNTNLIHSRTRIPTLIGSLDIGKHVIVSFVSGDNKEMKNINPDIAIIQDKIELLFNDSLVLDLSIDDF